MVNLKYDQSKLEQICHKYQVDFLGVFGSVARGDAKPNSDVDLLVKFQSQSKGGLFRLVRMRNDLQDLLRREVDLVTEGFLSKYFRNEVLQETKRIYG